MPLVRVAIPFIIGVLLAIANAGGEMVYWCLIAGGCLLYIVHVFTNLKNSFRFRFLSGLALHLVLIGMGGLSARFAEVPQSEIDGCLTDINQVLCIKVAAPPLLKKRSIQLEAKILREHGRPQIKGLFYFDTSQIEQIKDLRIGDVLYVYARLNLPDGPKNPLQFNYHHYLQNQGIYFQSFVGAGRLLSVKSSNQFSILQFSADVREWIVAKMKDCGLSGDELGIAGALVIGEEKNLSPEIKSAYSASGAMHVLSVSGLHIGIVYLMLRVLLAPLLAKPKLKRWVVPLLILVLWLYSFITGLSPSVQRATLMFSFVALGSVFGKSANIYNMLGASVIVLVLIQPTLVMDVGFQLSYLALAGIVVIQPPVYKLLFIKNKLLDKIWEITAVAIAAQLATGALSVYYFHQFPTFFLFSNLLVIPLSFVILVIGVFFIVFCWVPGLSMLLGWCLKQSTFILNGALIYLEGLPGSVIKNLYISGFDTWVLYVVLTLLIACLFLKSKLALFLSTALCCIWLSFLLWNNSRLETELIRVYSIPKSSVIGIFSGRDNLVISNVPRSNQFDFFLGNHLIKMGCSQFKVWRQNYQYPTTVKSLPDGNKLLIGNREIALLVLSSPNFNSYRGIAFDYVLVENATFKWNGFNSIQAKRIVLGNSLEARVRKKMKRYLTKSGLVVTELNLIGSFIIK